MTNENTFCCSVIPSAFPEATSYKVSKALLWMEGHDDKNLSFLQTFKHLSLSEVLVNDEWHLLLLLTAECPIHLSRDQEI